MDTKPQTVKEILLALVASAEDLRISQGYLFDRLDPRVSLQEMADYKSAMSSATNNLYKTLRESIEALP